MKNKVARFSILQFFLIFVKNISMNKIFSLPIFAGIVFYDNKNEVVSTVSPYGKITLKSRKNQDGVILHPNTPLLRGLEYIFFSTVLFFKGLQQSFYNANQKSVFDGQNALGKKNLYLITILIFFGILTGFYLIGMASTHLGFVIFPNSYSFFVKNLSIAFVRVTMVYLLLFALTFLPFLTELWRFNQAGNEAVAGSKHRALNYYNILISSLLTSIFSMPERLFALKILPPNVYSFLKYLLYCITNP